MLSIKKAKIFFIIGILLILTGEPPQDVQNFVEAADQ
jgi:hypothetical protein